jgi:hypothetical protein
MSHFHVEPKKWQHHELEVLHIEMKKGSTIEQILRLLPHRTYSSVQGRIRWENMSRDQKDAKNVRVAVCRRNKKDRRPASTSRQDEAKRCRAVSPYVHSIGTRPPAFVLTERDQRSAIMPRNLTAAFFGDPLPGHSALDRRQ